MGYRQLYGNLSNQGSAKGIVLLSTADSYVPLCQIQHIPFIL